MTLNESFFSLYQGGKEVNSGLDKQESSEVGEDGEEDNSDTEDITTDSNKETNEGGKKDPFLRRQELLVNSGLAEVGNSTAPFARLYEYLFLCIFAVFILSAILHLLPFPYFYHWLIMNLQLI